MGELEKVQAPKVTMMIHGKEREIKYGFSAWAKIEAEYNGLENIEKLQEDIERHPFKTIPHLIWIGLKDREGVTEQDVLDEYGLNDVQYITDIFQRALYGSLPQDSKKGVEAKE